MSNKNKDLFVLQSYKNILTIGEGILCYTTGCFSQKHRTANIITRALPLNINGPFPAMLCFGNLHGTLCVYLQHVNTSVCSQEAGAPLSLMMILPTEELMLT